MMGYCIVKLLGNTVEHKDSEWAEKHNKIDGQTGY